MYRFQRWFRGWESASHKEYPIIKHTGSILLVLVTVFLIYSATTSSPKHVDKEIEHKSS